MQGKRTPSAASQTLLGIATMAAPVLLLASTIAYATSGGFNHDQTGGVIQVYAMAAFMPVILGLTRVVEGRFPRAAAVLALAGGIGIAGGVGYGIDAVHLAETGATAEDFGAAGPLALQVPGAFFPLTSFSLGVALARAAIEPRWSGILLCVAAVLFPVSRIGSIEPLGLAVDVLFVAALWPLGWQMLRGNLTFPAVNARGLASQS